MEMILMLNGIDEQKMREKDIRPFVANTIKLDTEHLKQLGVVEAIKFLVKKHNDAVDEMSRKSGDFRYGRMMLMDAPKPMPTLEQVVRAADKID